MAGANRGKSMGCGDRTRADQLRRRGDGQLRRRDGFASRVAAGAGWELARRRRQPSSDGLDHDLRQYRDVTTCLALPVRHGKEKRLDAGVGQPMQRLTEADVCLPDIVQQSKRVCKFAAPGPSRGALRLCGGQGGRQTGQNATSRDAYPLQDIMLAYVTNRLVTRRAEVYLWRR